MSWHYSQALVAAYSAENCLDGAAFAPSSTTATPEAYSWQDKTTDVSRRSRSGMMSAPLTDDRGEAVLMWCLGDSLARTSLPPEREKESPESGRDSGPRWRALSVRYDHNSSGWKTARCLLEEDLHWSSLTLPRWGSLHDGELWERTTQEPRTSGTGFGCWPTPRASDFKGAVSATDCTARRVQSGEANLCEAVVESLRMWPTPTVQDASNNGSLSQHRRNAKPLNAVAGGALNPMWVEWLMGWPLGWTDCAASATDRYREWFKLHGSP